MPGTARSRSGSRNGKSGSSDSLTDGKGNENEDAHGNFKEPVAGRAAVRALNLDGDRQADLTVHGGREKAVYATGSLKFPWASSFSFPFPSVRESLLPLLPFLL